MEDLRKLCESPFEREMYDELTQRGYWVTPQVRVGQYRIDMVVEGHNDARLAVECDGDKYHGADKWADDMQRAARPGARRLGVLAVFRLRLHPPAEGHAGRPLEDVGRARHRTDWGRRRAEERAYRAPRRVLDLQTGEPSRRVAR